MTFKPPQITNVVQEKDYEEYDEYSTWLEDIGDPGDIEEIPEFLYNTLYFHRQEGLVSVKDIEPEDFIEEMNKLNPYFSWLKPKDVESHSAREAFFEMYMVILSKMKL
jgi:hypothetical protein